MVKKKAVKKTKAKTPTGAGKKQCPSCDQIIAARSSTCPHCQHKFGGKRRKEKAPSVAAPSPAAPATSGSDVATILAAHELIKRSGGIRQAKAALDTAEQAAIQSRAY
jgi:hypothetical protein